MGRAIDMEKRQDEFDMRLKELENILNQILKGLQVEEEETDDKTDGKSSNKSDNTKRKPKSQSGKSGASS